MRSLISFRRTLSLLLTVALLSNQALAMTAVGFIGVWRGEQQHLSFWWRAGGWAKTVAALPLMLTGQQTKPAAANPETQAERDARVAEIKIQPGDVTAQTGERVVLQAIAYDFGGHAVAGAKFTWSANDEGRKAAVKISPQGEFVSPIDGIFKVTAYGVGRAAHVIIKVVGEPFQPKPKEAVPTGTVSTRDVPSAKSDTSFNRGQAQRGYQRGQVAEAVTQLFKRNSLPDYARRSFKATARALTTTPLFQLWGDPYGWTDQNYMTADDCGKEVGDMPGHPVDDGAGSGNHQFTAPILGLEGRGLDLALALSYNSRVWHKANNEITFDIDRDWPAPGFSVGFGKITQTGLSHGFLLIDGDGTRHGFNCTWTPYGMQCNTNDGSFIDYDITTSSYPVSNTPISATAKMPDGTVITYGAPATYAVYPTLITDRNGNYTTISYVNNQGPQIDTITDTVGRCIKFYYDAAGCLTAITAPDFNTGTTRTLVRLNYTDLTLSYNYTTNPTPKVRASSFKMVKAIYYPATATGYWLGDSGSYSSYGMLLKVCEQRGMVFDNNTALTTQGSITAGTMSREMTYDFNSPSTVEPMFTEMREKWAGMDTSAPGIDATTLAAKTTYQVVEEPTKLRRSTRIVRPDSTIQVQWQVMNPGQFDDGLIYYDKTCAPNTACLADAPGDPASPGLRGSSVNWEPGYYGAPRPRKVTHYYRPWQQVQGDQAIKSKDTIFTYGTPYNNQVTQTDEYDYFGLLARTTTTQYLNYTAQHIFGLPTMVEVKEGAVVKQHTEYTYDTYSGLLNTSGAVTHFNPAYDPYDPNHDPATDLRGLLTTVKRFPIIGSTNGLVTETRTYDKTGNLLTAATSCCEQTSFTYTSNTQFAYPETQKRGSASDPNTQITTSAVYNLCTGLVTQTTDANGRVSTTDYYQSSGSTPGTLRPKDVWSPTGAKVHYDYNDTNLTVNIRTYASGGTTLGAGSDKTLDGIGRVCNEIAYGAMMVQDKVDTKYDGLGRVWKQTRPYRAGDTQQWYENFYDELDRLKKVCTTIGGQTETLVEKFYDEAALPSVADPAGKGNTIRTKDAWGRERWARFDWADRLCEVVEPDPNASGKVFGDNNGPDNGWLTKYSYDVLNNLIQANQGVQSGVAEQTRTFKYDGMSRLTNQKLAERDATLNDTGAYVGGTGAWSDAFTYDTRSNLLCHTDTRGVKTNFNYNSDPLNRLQSVGYDKTGAPTAASIIDAATVTYNYMTSGDRTRLMKITDGAGTDEFAYDVEGRLCETKRSFTNRTSYPLQVNYLFDTLDRAYQVTYPTEYGQSGLRKVVAGSFDEASRLNTLTYDSKNYASAVTYNAASQTTALTVGHNLNGGIPWNETYTYDQATGLLTNQKVQATNSGTSALDLSYDYLKYNTTVGRTGQLTKIINNKDLTKSKYYDYDALGRLKTAYSFTNPNNPMTTNQWTQGYTYDRFGNRTGVTKTGTITYTDGLASLSFTDGAGKVRSNRVTTAGYTYDEAGNLTRGQSEGASTGTSVWQRYQYDAAGRLACTKDDSSVLIADYSYGASNHRLKQTEYGSGGTTCYYAWDGNSIITEFSDTGSALSWTKSYVFLGGRLLATPTPGGTNYHHPDRLGTRLVTSETNGIVAAEQTTLPYGTALDVESTGTATNRRFTSYDRSQKTKLDYAVNRFYSACQGRFTQVDPIGMSAASLENPQTLNLYAYVGNDPINRIDPTGLFWGWLAKAFKFIFKVAAALLVAVILVVQPELGATLLLLGIAGLAGLAGWHNGKLGEIAGKLLTFGGYRPNFRTPGINGNAGVSGVSNFLATQQGGSNKLPKFVLSAIELARKALEKTSCKDLFGSNASPIALLNDLASGNAGRGSISVRNLGTGSGGNVTAADTTGILGSRTLPNGTRQSIFTGANVVINNDSRAPFQTGYGGRFGASIKVNRAITIIHELGHAANIITGAGGSSIVDDQGNPEASKANSQRVYDACFKK